MKSSSLSALEEKLALKKRLAQLEEENEHLKIVLAIAIEKEHKKETERSIRYVREHLEVHTKEPRLEKDENNGRPFVNMKIEPAFCTWDGVPMTKQPDWRKNY